MILPTVVTWSDVLYDEKFIIACISLLGGLVTYFGYVTKTAIARLQLKADATHEQVANTHDTNLRDDMDEKFEAVMGELLKITSMVAQSNFESGKQHAAMWQAINAKSGSKPPPRKKRKRK